MSVYHERDRAVAALQRIEKALERYTNAEPDFGGKRFREVVTAALAEWKKKTDTERA